MISSDKAYALQQRGFIQLPLVRSKPAVNQKSAYLLST